jgi:hypothetical protein
VLFAGGDPHMIISIPATLVSETMLRCWTCYPHQIGGYTLVDTEEYFHDIRVADIETMDDDGALAIVQRWRKTRTGQGLLILAYQFIRMERIVDDRSEWGHEPQTTRKVAEELSLKTFVYAGPGNGVYPWKELRQDKAWVDAQMKLDARKRDDSRFSRRHLSANTGEALGELSARYRLRLADDILKLGPATYVRMTPDLRWMPNEAFNPVRKHD